MTAGIQMETMEFTPSLINPSFYLQVAECKDDRMGTRQRAEILIDCMQHDVAKTSWHQAGPIQDTL